MRVLECVQDGEGLLSNCLEIEGLALLLSIFFPEVFGSGPSWSTLNWICRNQKVLSTHQSVCNGAVS